MSGGEERCMQGLVGKPEGNRPLGRPRRRWKDDDDDINNNNNNNMDRREVKWGHGLVLSGSG